MANQNPTTLVMLLSMAKLQQGQMPVGGYDKRWQTPEEVYTQTYEAAAHLKNAGRAVDKIVLLYTDNLYLNNDLPAMGLLEKFQSLTLDHRKKTQKLFAQDEIKLPIVEMLWNELVQGQNEYQGPRVKLKQFYQNNADFRAAVQNDNPKRMDANSALTPNDMFVMEETGLFDGLAKGQIVSDKINPDHDLVIAYPGLVMQSLEAIQQQRLQIFKGRPLRAMDKPNTTTWLDLSVKDQPVEKTVYNFIPHPEAVKKAQQKMETIQPEKKKISFLQSNPMKVAASILLPIAMAATWFVTKPKAEWKNPEPVIHENYYAATVTYYSGENNKYTVTMAKDSANEKPELWTAERIQHGENDPGRLLLFREDMGYVQDADRILAKQYRYKSIWDRTP
jgi:hypothetical protein